MGSFINGFSLSFNRFFMTLVVISIVIITIATVIPVIIIVDFRWVSMTYNIYANPSIFLRLGLCDRFVYLLIVKIKLDNRWHKLLKVDVVTNGNK